MEMLGQEAPSEEGLADLHPPAQGSQELLYPLPQVSDDGPRCVCDQAAASLTS